MTNTRIDIDWLLANGFTIQPRLLNDGSTEMRITYAPNGNAESTTRGEGDDSNDALINGLTRMVKKSYEYLIDVESDANEWKDHQTAKEKKLWLRRQWFELFDIHPETGGVDDDKINRIFYKRDEMTELHEWYGFFTFIDNTGKRVIFNATSFEISSWVKHHFGSFIYTNRSRQMFAIDIMPHSIDEIDRKIELLHTIDNNEFKWQLTGINHIKSLHEAGYYTFFKSIDDVGNAQFTYVSFDELRTYCEGKVRNISEHNDIHAVVIKFEPLITTISSLDFEDDDTGIDDNAINIPEGYKHSWKRKEWKDINITGGWRYAFDLIDSDENRYMFPVSRERAEQYIKTKGNALVSTVIDQRAHIIAFRD